MEACLDGWPTPDRSTQEIALQINRKSQNQKIFLTPNRKSNYTLPPSRASMIQLCYNPNFTQQYLSDWIKGEGQCGQVPPLAKKMAGLEAFLAKQGGVWWAGRSLTSADMLMWELLDQHRQLFKGCLDNFATLSGQVYVSITIYYQTCCALFFLESALLIWAWFSGLSAH